LGIIGGDIIGLRGGERILLRGEARRGEEGLLRGEEIGDAQTGGGDIACLLGDDDPRNGGDVGRDFGEGDLRNVVGDVALFRGDKKEGEEGLPRGGELEPKGEGEGEEGRWDLGDSHDCIKFVCRRDDSMGGEEGLCFDGGDMYALGLNVVGRGGGSEGSVEGGGRTEGREGGDEGGEGRRRSEGGVNGDE